MLISELGYSLSPLLFIFILEVKNSVIRQKKKHMKFRKEEIKLAPFTNDICRIFKICEKH